MPKKTGLKDYSLLGLALEYSIKEYLFFNEVISLLRALEMKLFHAETGKRLAVRKSIDGSPIFYKVKTPDAIASSLKGTNESINHLIKKELESPSSSSSTIASQTKTITNSGNFTMQLLRLQNELRASIKKDRMAQKKLIDEIAKQLPNDLSRNAIEKRVERAKNIYNLFKAIDEKKIYWGTASNTVN
ncbi:5630_t:CDS:2 [Ambispora gerdemannii]|uniref:5630_t:CDS:1 n=1 Tax=Ambispora gerdemannii TaxID=144530 RepID=A0A9N9A5P7_9GLOM|nr:5630_t:CDS:2 [Ambispora gerdemannii]